MIKKIGQILEGWAKLAYDKVIGLSSAAQEQANLRISICNECPVRTGNRCDPKKSGLNVKTGKTDKGCGCILTAKVVSPGSECPLGKW